jgi:hypothetical protein
MNLLLRSLKETRAGQKQKIVKMLACHRPDAFAIFSIFT